MGARSWRSPATGTFGSTASKRYYLADEASDLRRHFETAPASFDAVLFP